MLLQRDLQLHVNTPSSSDGCSTKGLVAACEQPGTSTPCNQMDATRGTCCLHIVNPCDQMDGTTEGLVVCTQSTLWTRWMLQQVDLQSVHSQPFGLDGCCNGWTCCLHIVNPVQFSWTQQQMDLLVWLDTCIVQMDDAADGLATCTQMLYINVTVMPEEKFLV